MYRAAILDLAAERGWEAYAVKCTTDAIGVDVETYFLKSRQPQDP